MSARCSSAKRSASSSRTPAVSTAFAGDTEDRLALVSTDCSSHPEDVVRELRVGHDAAVAEALGYLEREACRGRRGTDGAVQVRGEGFVGAAFVHRPSRAGDPLLHTYVVVGNLTRGPDRRWTALDGRHLRRQAKTAGYLFNQYCGAS